MNVSAGTIRYVTILFLVKSAFLWAACNGPGEGDRDGATAMEPDSPGEVSDEWLEESLAYMDPDSAATFPGVEWMGEFEGSIYLDEEQDSVMVGLQVALYGPWTYRALLYKDGLPGDGESAVQPDRQIELAGEKREGAIRLRPVEEEHEISVRLIHGTYTVLDSDRNYIGHLDRVKRESPTLGQPAPDNAVHLFGGRSEDLDHWDEETRLDGDLLEQGATSREEYGDMRLHLEAKLGFMPNAPDQQRTNSGIYIQNRYEVQILDSFALPVAVNGNASLYNEVEPIENMTFPPLTWQTYDIWFRAPRFDETGEKTENTRVTVYLNGVRVIDDEGLEQGTGRGGQFEEVPEAELYLQDHTGPVRFRNVWIVEGEYNPPQERRLTGEVE